MSSYYERIPVSQWRTYEVNLVAEDENGNKIEMKEFAIFPERSSKKDDCVSETDREKLAILQVRYRMPNLRNIKATHSSHILESDRKTL